MPMVRYRFRPYFYPRPPHGGRHESSSEGGGQSNFYPRPAQKAADHPRISIHALLTEGDNIGSGRPSGRTYFYPRPPHGGRPLSCMTFFWPLDFYPRPPRGGRRFQDAVDVVPLTFLSTPSARRETSCQRGLCPPGGYFYPRPPRGGRLAALSWSTPSWGFLSTPSARRATCITGGFQRSRFLFLSTPSARRATKPTSGRL